MQNHSMKLGTRNEYRVGWGCGVVIVGEGRGQNRHTHPGMIQHFRQLTAGERGKQTDYIHVSKCTTIKL